MLDKSRNAATKEKSGFFEYLMWWKLDKEEVRQQIANYQSLKITKSFRGISTLLLLGSSLITLVTSLIGWFSFDNLYGLVLYLPLTLFVYKGKRWAIIVMMILWTLEKALGITASFPSIMIALTWWALYMRFLYGALKVENERIKEKKNQPAPVTQIPHIYHNQANNSHKNFISVFVALILCAGVIGGIYLNHQLQLQRQLQQQEYEKQVQLTKQKEEQQKQQEIYEAESKNYWKQVELNDRLDNIENSLQNQEDEASNQRNCEANNGRYMGNGVCALY